MAIPTGHDLSTLQTPLVDVLPAPVFVARDRRFVYVNHAFSALFGVDPSDLIGRNILERVHPHDRGLMELPGTGSEPPAYATAQVRIRRRDEVERVLLITVVPVADADGSAMLGTAIDVTLQPDALNLSVRMAALGRLAGGIAHDFNNLLLVIGGQIERIRRAASSNREVAQALDAMEAAARRAASLTDRLLSFGRGQMLVPQVIDLDAFVADIEQELADRAGKNVRVATAQGSSHPVAVRVDRARLTEVLYHLVDNAREAMPSGGTLTIGVDTVTIDEALHARWSFLAPGRHFVRLRVADTGAGMDAAIVPHVFEPFFTTKGRGRGAGMGLASVYGFVKQSAGYVFVERTGADGTCVTILLPPAAIAEQTVHAPSPAPTPSSASGSACILLVEDDAAVRELLDDVLTTHGFAVLQAETAEQAEELAGRQRIDLLLSDIDLPGKSGAHLAAALRARIPDLPVLLMSGYPDDGAIEAAGLSARPRVLRKPFATARLVAAVRDVLGPSSEPPNQNS